MTQSIQAQADTNRALLLDLPTYCNFAEVWNPEALRFEVKCVFQTYDTGTTIQNSSVTVNN
jgi:hypothetical protein